MKATELRIGNWVNFYSSISGETKPTQIWPDWFSSTADQNDSSPIPLTPEILEKAGFVKWEGRSQTFEKTLKQGVLQINLSESDFFTGGHESCVSGMGFINEIKYLHQLQNLHFALTGQELEIKL